MRQRVSSTDKAQADEAKTMREERLMQAICEADFGMARSLRILYMYYDCHRPTKPDAKHAYHLSIWENPAYCSEILEKCLLVIVN